MVTETGFATACGHEETTASAARLDDGGTASGDLPFVVVLEEPEMEVLPSEFEEGDAWMYSEDAEAELAEAEAEARQGQVDRFSSLDGLLDDLNAD